MLQHMMHKSVFKMQTIMDCWIQSSEVTEYGFRATSKEKKSPNPVNK